MGIKKKGIITKNSKRKDEFESRGAVSDWVIASLCVSLGIFGLSLVNSPALWDRFFSAESSGEIVGEVIREEGGVRIKPQGGMFWQDVLRDSHSVGDGDTIFTSDNGEAIIRLIDASSLKLSPRSLVVVQLQREGGTGEFDFLAFRPVLQIDQGNVELEVAEGSSGVSLRTSTQTVTISGEGGQKANVRLTRDSESPDDSLQIEAGTLASVNVRFLDASGVLAPQEFQVGRGEALRRGEDGQLRVSLSLAKLLSPLSNSRVLARSERSGGAPEVQIFFEWSWPDELLAGAALKGTEQVAQLEIQSRTGASQRIPLTAQTSLEHALPPGDYRWRLLPSQELSRDSRVAATGWSAFSVFELSPPVVVSPANQAIIPSASEGAYTTLFRVQSLSRQTSSEIEIQNQLNEKTLGQELMAADRVFYDLMPGGYRWRVRSVLKDSNERSAWGAWSYFEIAAQERASEEELLSEAEIEIVDLLEKVTPPPLVVRKPKVFQLSLEETTTLYRREIERTGLGVTLSWKEMPRAENYRVRVINSQQQTVFQEEMKEQEVFLRFQRGYGLNLRYLVEAVSSGEVLARGEGRVALRFVPPQLGNPIQGGSISKGESYPFTWSRTFMTSQYVIEVSRSEDFREIVTRLPSSLNFSKITLKERGRYFWRVKSIGSGEESAWSQVRSFEVK
jgi:hypothetical protein